MAAAYILSPWCPQQFTDGNSDPVANGTAFFYAPGTTTGQQTFSDTSGTLNANPGVPLNSQGRPTSGAIYLDSSLGYKLVLKDSLGVTISTYDPLYTAPTNSDNSICQGRLTLTSGTPFPTADVSGATTAYWTPCYGNLMTFYNGTIWTPPQSFSEIPISLVGLTASRPVDVFGYNNGGTVAIELLAWASTSARATATVLQNGVLVKSGDSTRRWLGSIHINSSGGQTDNTFTKRYIDNEYNQRPRVLRRLETNATWTYTTATVRQAGGSPANQVEVMVGQPGRRLALGLQVGSRNTNADILRSVGIGEDSTTTFMAQDLNTGIHDGGGTIAIGALINHVVRLTHYPAVGLHVYSWNEISAATGTTTWIGQTAPTSGTNASQAGLSGEIDG